MTTYTDRIPAELVANGHLVRRTLVPPGCTPTKDAADLLDAIKGDLDV